MRSSKQAPLINAIKTKGRFYSKAIKTVIRKKSQRSGAWGGEWFPHRSPRVVAGCPFDCALFAFIQLDRFLDCCYCDSVIRWSGLTGF